MSAEVGAVVELAEVLFPLAAFSAAAVELVLAPPLVPAVGTLLLLLPAVEPVGGRSFLTEPVSGLLFTSCTDCWIYLTTVELLVLNDLDIAG